IAEFGHWGPSVPADAAAWNWIPGWPLRRMSNMMFSALLVLSLALAVTLRQAIRSHAGVRNASILALVGIVYVLASAPDLVFALGDRRARNPARALPCQHHARQPPGVTPRPRCCDDRCCIRAGGGREHDPARA